jgi:hypothetical protein
VLCSAVAGISATWANSWVGGATVLLQLTRRISGVLLPDAELL